MNPRAAEAAIAVALFAFFVGIAGCAGVAQWRCDDRCTSGAGYIYAWHCYCLESPNATR